PKREGVSEERKPIRESPSEARRVWKKMRNHKEWLKLASPNHWKTRESTLQASLRPPRKRVTMLALATHSGEVPFPFARSVWHGHSCRKEKEIISPQSPADRVLYWRSVGT